ncbi:MAG: TetR/AcrR family transcriptional regulator C-terminal domain-containing protein [Myxococcaceae bacterium]|nr:TetR/AcrR family transcriptional regulator C-terminal domain-containing protein [Myxococcaceae bacterium]MCI0672388.1 TetR/AcrR family transcriptional regulator C-terminal domain-containing protein [Myxococcaceae bacterium]
MAKKPKARAKRRTPLSREKVLRAAVTLADEIGIGSLSMRRLGEELGVEAMSLYKHAANKDDILDGIVDLVVSEIQLPTIGGDWKVAMRRRATSAHEVLLRHPWATMLIVSRANVGPAMLRYVDATIGCLREAGFSYAMSDHAWNAVDSHVYGFTLQKLNFPFQPEEYAVAAKAFLPKLPADRYPYLRGLSQQVIDGSHDGLHDFQFGLELILDGLERVLRSG